MNYSEFYTNAKRQLTDALLSLWASGKKEKQNYLRYIFDKREPLLAEPVFQTIFPWNISPNTFEEHGTKLSILDNDFINALSECVKDKEFRFSKDRYPYTHQTISWSQLLNRKKTIVVTSGTGSGKTECFMIPVLQDLLRQKKEGRGHGVQAIFLYPLNALMDSQKNRVLAWCDALSPKINFAVYNGDTPNELQASIERSLLPEIGSRKSIRSNPPQILFTNPTMLEYMLVRADDKPILDKSQGSLRWILLDETHTYSGSAAAELALQLRRVLDAFGVTVDDVNFAATSATIGNGGDQQLKQFVAQLTGKDVKDIVAVNGERVVPLLNENILVEELNKINREFNIDFTPKDIYKLREKINITSALTATEITACLGKELSVEEKLAIIDRLGNKVKNLSSKNIFDAILPTRAHFFIRSLGGLFVCTNSECENDSKERISIGSLTTNVETTCRYCGSQLLEVAFCNSCGEFLIIGESNDETKKYRMVNNLSDFSQSLFEMIQEEEGDDDDIRSNTQYYNNWKKFALVKFVANKPRNKSHLSSLKLDAQNSKYGKPDSDKENVFQQCSDDNGSPLCPHCGSSEYSDESVQPFWTKVYKCRGEEFA